MYITLNSEVVMKLLRKDGAGMDFAFADLCLDEQNRYAEMEYPVHPAYEYQVKQAIEECINEDLPEGMHWDFESCILTDKHSNKYAQCEEVQFYNGTFAICPEAYEQLDALAPAAVEYAIKKVFGAATKKY